MTVRPAGLQKESDEVLIASFQAGDLGAFNQLVGKYKHQLLNFVFRYLGDHDEADDVVQETFIRVYQKKHTYQPVARFSTWVYTIATNLAKTQLRRRKRLGLFSISSKRAEYGERDFELRDESTPADAAAERALRQGVIQNALMSVPEKYREVIILFEIQELSYEEICEITGLNIGTLKSRLNRGRAQLQLLLKQLHDEDKF